MNELVIDTTEQRVSAARQLSISELLRCLGTLILLTSPAIFMLQRWDEMNHITRYYSFLGLTGLIAATGFFCALKLRENKGARTLLAVTAAIIPVHFLQLGALTYSKTADYIPSMPQFLLWTAPSTSSLMTLLTVAAIGLIPITYIAFSTLARQKSLALSAIYLLACAQLLIPVRDPASITIVIAFTFTLLVSGYLYSLERAACMRTREGYICQIMLCVPLLSLIVRQLYLYNANYTFTGGVSAVLAVVFFCLVPRAIDNRNTSFASQLVGTALALNAAHLLVHSCLNSFGLNHALPHLSQFVPYAAVLFGLSGSMIHFKSGYRSAASVLLVAGVVQEVLFSHNIVGLSVCLILTMTVIVVAFMQQEKLSFGAGIVCFAVSLVRFVQYAIPFASISPWVGLAVLGLVTVVLGSYMEQDNNKIQVLYAATKTRLGFD